MRGGTKSFARNLGYQLAAKQAEDSLSSKGNRNSMVV